MSQNKNKNNNNNKLINTRSGVIGNLLFKLLIKCENMVNAQEDHQVHDLQRKRELANELIIKCTYVHSEKVNPLLFRNLVVIFKLRQQTERY